MEHGGDEIFWLRFFKNKKEYGRSPILLSLVVSDYPIMDMLFGTPCIS